MTSLTMRRGVPTTLVGAVGLLVASLCFASETSHLSSQLKTLGLRFALLIESQAIDEEPVWSPDGRFLAVNMDGKWSRLDTESVVLTMGTWQDRKTIAVPHPPAELANVSEAEIRKWQKSAHSGPRAVTTKTGVEIELAPEGLGTAFRVTSPRREPEVLWTTGLENCHSLALSPDESLAAFLCEKNGLVVFAVPP